MIPFLWRRVAILSYVLPVLVGGNGYLSAYIAGIILGNAKIPNKKNQVLFFDGVTSFMQLMVFFLLGLLCTPSRLGSVILPALAIAVVLTFVVRPLVVALLLTPFRSKLSQQLLVSWAGLRGATSAIFALTAAASGAVLQYDLFHLVFCVVLFSIALQGTLLPLVSRKLHMIDESADVLKTFNDYTEKKELQLLRRRWSRETAGSGSRSVRCTCRRIPCWRPSSGTGTALCHEGTRCFAKVMWQYWRQDTAAASCKMSSSVKWRSQPTTAGTARPWRRCGCPRRNWWCWCAGAGNR